jgi:hypothetical protein
MNDLHMMSLSGNALRRAISDYRDKCLLLLQQAFGRDTDTQQAFAVWLGEEFRETKSPDVLLHDPPLRTVARFLGIPDREIDQSIIRKAKKVAEDHLW